MDTTPVTAHARRRLALTSAAAGSLAVALAPAALAQAGPVAPAGYQIRPFAHGGAGLTNPDDITRLGDTLYVTYQNDAGPDGTPAGSHSVVVGYRPDGSIRGQWTLAGRCDGLTADPEHHRLIATVNEDANSSVYTISAAGLRHYNYSSPPPHGGGTDAVTISHGQAYVSASNPSPTTPNGSVFAGPALYRLEVPKRGSTATLEPVFDDNSQALVGNGPGTTTLNLSDPDSNNTVPYSSPRFAGDVMLDSQGDSQLIFASHPGSPQQTLTELPLTSSAGAPQVDDVEWARRSNGTMFVVDQKADTIYTVTGPFAAGAAFAAVPSGSPAAGELGTLDLASGAVTPFITGFQSPKGLLYLSGSGTEGGHHGGGNERGDGTGGQDQLGKDHQQGG